MKFIYPTIAEFRNLDKYIFKSNGKRKNVLKEFVRFNILIESAYLSLEMHDTGKLPKIIKDLKRIAENLEDIDLELLIEIFECYRYGYSGELQKREDATMRLKKNLKKTKQEIMIFTGSATLGGVLASSGDKQGLKYLDLALKLAEKNEDKKRLEIIMQNYLAALLFLKEFDRAKSLYRKISQLDSFDKNIYIKLKIENNAGILFSKFKDYKKAEEHFFNAYKLAGKLNFEKYQASSLGHLAGILFYNGKFREAAEDFKILLSQFKDKHFHRHRIAWLTGLVSCYVRLADFKSAIFNQKKLVDVFSKSGNLSKLSDSLQDLANFYLITDNPNKLNNLKQKIYKDYFKTPSNLKQQLNLYLKFLITIHPLTQENKILKIKNRMSKIENEILNGKLKLLLKYLSQNK